MQKAKLRLAIGRKRLPIVLGRPKDAQRADDVGLHKQFRSVDRPVDMALCRQMQDGVRSMLGESCCNGRAVANIGSHKDVMGILVRFFQKSQVGSIGQVVDVDHECRFCQQLPHNRRPYEAGSTGNKNAFHTLRLMWPRLLVRCARGALLCAGIAAFSNSPKHQADDQAQLPELFADIHQFDAIGAVSSKAAQCANG